MKALLIPPEGKVERVEFEEDNPSQWVNLIGGRAIDFITLREAGIQVMVDDHSITDSHPMNPRVTWFVKGTGRWLSEVYGTALVVGVESDSGESEDLHEVLYEALLATDS